MKIKTLLGVLGILLPLLSVHAQQIKPLNIGDTVPDLVLHNILNYKDITARLSDFKGQAIWIDFFATWCTPCIRDIPRLDSFQWKYKGKLKIILATYENKEKVIMFQKTNNGFGKASLLTMTQEEELRKYLPYRKVPHTVLLDKHHVIRAITFSSRVNDAEIRRLLSDGMLDLPFKGDSLNGIPFYPLSAKVSSLQEVIVSTGYQQIPKERATGAFSKISNDLLNQQVGSNILDRLNGVANGLLFDQRQNVSNILIRGLGTLSASSDPLIILDNFPYAGDIANINPNDIQDVTLLRDAAAASIWGAQASNGVIVITTKKAHYSQPIKVEVNANTTVTGKTNAYYRPLMGSAEYIEVEKFLFDKGYYNTALGNTTSYPVVSPAVEIFQQQKTGALSVAQADEAIQILQNTDVRDQLARYWYKTAAAQQEAVNLHGGGINSNWLFSAGWDGSTTSLSDKVGRLTLRSENTFRPVKGLEMTTGIIYTKRQTTFGRPAASTALSPASGTTMYPYTRIVADEGNVLPVPKTYREAFLDTVGGGYLLDWKYYPLDDWKHTANTTSLQDILARVQATYALPWGISASVQYQYQQQQSTNRVLQDMESYYTRDFINRYTQVNRSNGTVTTPVPKGGILDKTFNNLNSHNGRAQLNYQHSWDRHHLSALEGGEIRQTRQDYSQYRTFGYNDEFGTTSGNMDFANYYPLYLGSQAKIPGGTGAYFGMLNRFVSVFGNAAYNYASKYTFSASIRKDRSNLFGVSANQKGRPFWSSGLAWDLSREPFYHVGGIPYLKMRLTYGTNGNVDNSMSALTTIAYLGSNLYTGLPYAVVSNYANPDLKWEKSATINWGIDFNIGDSRITGSLDAYQKNSTDILANYPVDITTGLSDQYVKKNVASARNRGLELLVNIHWLQRNNLHWQSSLITNYNTNVVTKYYLSTSSALTYIGYGDIVSPREGKPVYAYYSFKWAGLDPENGNPRGYLNGTISTDYTSILQTTTFDSLVYNGPATPPLYIALSNTLSYRQFSLTWNITGKFGHYFRKSALSYDALLRGNNQPDYSSRWQRPGDEKSTNVPSMVYPNDANRDGFYQLATINVYKASNIRLQFIRMLYTVSNSFQVYSNIFNIGILWKASHVGIDPDYGNATPPSLSISLGIKANF